MKGRNSEVQCRASRVSGMTCGHCVRAVTDAIKSVDAAATVDVDLDVGRVSVRNHTISPDQIADAITAEGYTVEKLAA